MALDATLNVHEAADSVTFALQVRNDDDEPVELNFSDAQSVDVAVRDENEAVWRWGEGMAFAQMLQTETLAPGEQVSFEATWDDPRPGAYTVVATLLAREHDVEAREQFSV